MRLNGVLNWFTENRLFEMIHGINKSFTFIYMNQYNNKQHLHKFDYYLPNIIHQIKKDN